MLRLGSPQRVLYLIDSRDTLDALITRLDINQTLAGNLRQLCDYAQTKAPYDPGIDIDSYCDHLSDSSLCRPFPVLPRVVRSHG